MKTLFWLAVVGAVIFLVVFPRRAAADVLEMPSTGSGAGAGSGSASSAGAASSAAAPAATAAICGAECAAETRIDADETALRPWQDLAAARA